MDIQADKSFTSIHASREELAELGAFFTGIAAAPGAYFKCSFVLGASGHARGTEFIINVADARKER